MSSPLVYKLLVPHTTLAEGCSESWLVLEPVARDTLGRRNHRLPEHSTKNWLLLGCNSIECEARAVVRIDDLVTARVMDHVTVDQPIAYVSLAWLPEAEMQAMERRRQAFAAAVNAMAS